MDPLLLAALMSLGGAAFAYLIQQINKMEKRQETQEAKIEKLQFVIGVRDRAYQRVKRVAISEKHAKLKAQDEAAQWRERYTVAFTRQQLDSREGREPT